MPDKRIDLDMTITVPEGTELTREDAVDLLEWLIREGSEQLALGVRDGEFEPEQLKLAQASEDCTLEVFIPINPRSKPEGD